MGWRRSAPQPPQNCSPERAATAGRNNDVTFEDVKLREK
jgi:hypothetical protein